MSVRLFDLEDQNLADSKAYLFQPLAQEELRGYKLDETGLGENEDRYLHGFKDTKTLSTIRKITRSQASSNTGQSQSDSILS